MNQRKYNCVMKKNILSPKDEVALKEAFNPHIGTAFIKQFAGNR